MSGAKQTLLAQASNSNNMANANTTGFRADLAAFRSMPVYGPGAPSRVYAMAETAGVDTSQGALNATGRDMDIAVKGDGWIAVQADDGTEAYTRAGDLRVEEGGFLKNGAGLTILGNGGPISIPPAEKMEIGKDGTISIQGLGQTPNTLTVLDRIKLVKIDPAQLTKGQDGLMRLKDGGTAVPDASINVVSGALESSNVNTIDAMVNMIVLARQYESQVKMMKAAEDADSSATQLLSFSG
jgi:flagellar basal-body rod protein FlgF